MVTKIPKKIIENLSNKLTKSESTDKSGKLKLEYGGKTNMNNSFVEQIENILQPKKLILLSEYQINYEPEVDLLTGNTHSNYEILAGDLYLTVCRRKLSKKDFFRKVSKYI